MKVAILGFSPLEQSESLQTYRYFKDKGAEVTAYYWGDPEIPEDIAKQKIEEGGEIDGLDGFDLIVRGPAVHPRQIKTSKPVSSLTDIFVEQSPSRNIIGVTGTKGKGTTSTLIAKILEAAGKKAWLGGNIGRPLLDDLGNIKTDDWVVLEMSAGQLISFSQSIRIAVCLMVVPEHLNWHTDLAEYVNAKKQLFVHQSVDGLTVYNANNALSRDIAGASPARKLAFDVPPSHQGAPQIRDGAHVFQDTIFMGESIICQTSEVALKGRHNLENICAAISAVWEVTNHNTEAIQKVVRTFTGLEHRLELIRELEGVKYYDDSFGTTPETAIVAMEAFREPKVIILGGSDKGATYDNLAKAITGSNVSGVVVIGRTGPPIEEALRKAGYDKIHRGGSNIQEIVNTARSIAPPGSVVLLSTACASFDMFQNYKDRGEKFKQAVLELV